MEFDKEIIEASIFQQYHIPPSEQEDMTNSDWRLSLIGLQADTPLGRKIQVRTEKDPKRLKAMGAWEREERAEWEDFKQQRLIKQLMNMNEKELEALNVQEIAADDAFFNSLS